MNQRSSSELLSRFERHKTNWRTDLYPETVFKEPILSILNSYQYKSRDTTFQKVILKIAASFVCFTLKLAPVSTWHRRFDVISLIYSY